MSTKNIALQPDEELRTELIKLSLEQWYPSYFAQLQEEVRQVTNHIVRGRQDVKNAVAAYCIRNNLVGTPPSFPVRPVLSTPETEEDKKRVADAWSEYKVAKKIAAKKYAEWLAACFKAVKNKPECAWRTDDYKILRKMYCKLSGAVLIRDTVKRVIATKRANFKKKGDHIPLVFANTPIVETGSFYGDRRGVPFYNALIKVPIAPRHGRLFIKGRLRRPLPGRPVQGVSLFKESDGWYAAIKCIVKKKKLPEPILPPIGVDVGQTDLVALSDGYVKRNPRDAEFVKLKADIQKKGDLSGDHNFQQKCWNQIGRLDLSRKRWIRNWINSELLPKLQKHSTVFLEDLTKGFKSDRGPMSYMHGTIRAIRNRLGNRVIEVDRRLTSQTCSCCGNSTEIVREGKYFSCLSPDCMALLDADINAACNILKEGLTLLGIPIPPDFHVPAHIQSESRV